MAPEPAAHPVPLRHGRKEVAGRGRGRLLAEPPALDEGRQRARGERGRDPVSEEYETTRGADDGIPLRALGGPAGLVDTQVTPIGVRNLAMRRGGTAIAICRNGDAPFVITADDVKAIRAATGNRVEISLVDLMPPPCE